MPHRQHSGYSSQALVASLIATVLASNAIVFLAVTAAARTHAAVKPPPAHLSRNEARGGGAPSLRRAASQPPSPPGALPPLRPRSMITEQACYTRSDESGA
jgi:hypothetical protein